MCKTHALYAFQLKTLRMNKSQETSLEIVIEVKKFQEFPLKYTTEDMYLSMFPLEITLKLQSGS